MLLGQGARYTMGTSTLEPSLPRVLVTDMPIINARPVIVSSDGKKADPPGGDKGPSGVYECPVYSTQQRGDTFVFTATIRSRFPASKWVLAGVALIMDVGE